jgi:tRNA A37 N6-isopentenylltransferase MiaA
MNEKDQSNIIAWLHRESEKPKILLIYGPTASGKSYVSLEIATYLENAGIGSYIVSADARQIYK